jgi:pimeloyl-ACP methyl ester carboxylesterase
MSRNGPVVVLVHGWNGTPGNWTPIAEALRQDGRAVLTPRFPIDPWRRTLRRDAGILADFMAQTEHAGRPLAEQPALLVGYSRGGLVARAYQLLHRPERLAGMVHIGVPHLGCPIAAAALILPVAGLKEMDEDSDLLARLNLTPGLLSQCPQLAICGRADTVGGYNDLIVWEESATLSGRLPAAVVDLLPSAEAWHGNLICPWWIRLPWAKLKPNPGVWPHTLHHLRRFLASLSGG